jgi:hypothetical protein
LNKDTPVTTHQSRAAKAAAVHIRPINESRRKCGLAPLTLAEVASQFADLDRPAPRASVAPTTAGAADEMWGGIVSELNASKLQKPLVARGTAPEPDIKPNSRAVDWSSIATELNREAGLVTPARSAR